MSYETLDAIADSYIPILLALFVARLLSTLYKLWPNYQSVVGHLCFLFSLLIVSYGLMFFDNTVQLWSSVGLDYSTHTAVALSLVFSLCLLFSNQWKIFVVSIFAYAGLMLYQQYHSVLDMVSTAIVVGGIDYLLFNLVSKKYINIKL